jgi:glyoxylase-like metal-dependent hydrolase (beta-lactamase superfamily II)
MKIHHINCGTMCPFNAALTTRSGSWTRRGRIVCHCLLIETARGLVLVDTGLGLNDLANPRQRIGATMMAVGAPRLDESECAVRQVEALGFHAADVTDIVVTHLDFDHAGGIPDFPSARVHAHGAEIDAAIARATFVERERYKSAHWAHNPAWVRHREGGDHWMGFEAVRAVTERDPEVAIVPLHGHTRGHSAVAVREGDGWLLHAGDGYFFHDEMRATPWCPPGLALFQQIIAFDDDARRRNQARLRELVAGHPEVRVFSAHDPSEFDTARARPTR